MTLKGRLARLERSRDRGQGSRADRWDEEIEELRARATPEARARFDAVVERAGAAIEASGGFVDDINDALIDEYLDALTDLTTSAREFTEPQKRAEGGNMHGSAW